MLNWLFPAFLAMAAGLCFVVQQAVNSDLRVALQSAAWAGFVSYLGGTLCMLALALSMHEPFPGLINVSRSNWWAWSGGLFGAIYIAISILLLPRLGAAAFIALLITGQMLSSVAFDRFGILGLAQRSADSTRFLGVGLLIAGVLLIVR